MESRRGEKRGEGGKGREWEGRGGKGRERKGTINERRRKGRRALVESQSRGVRNERMRKEGKEGWTWMEMLRVLTSPKIMP